MKENLQTAGLPPLLPPLLRKESNKTWSTNIRKKMIGQSAQMRRMKIKEVSDLSRLHTNLQRCAVLIRSCETWLPVQ